MDRSRIGQIHADPSSATPAEIQSLAETAYEFHRTRGTKTLRDEFALIADRDEFGDLFYRNMSRTLGEKVVGRPHPGSDAPQMDVLQWDIDVRARLRFMFADAMLEARK